MPYLITFAKWPSDKTPEVVKKAIEAIKKFPSDESLGEDLVSGNAIKATEEGVRSISVKNVSKGKLEEAYTRGVAMGNLYSLAIEGFEYNIETWATVEEAYSSIGQKPPE
ncbi:MAG: hypothetical protein EAX91_18210 [Candidatus Lokiarchaeota archaeon]|nr:hypothetical protein [Candidatus Lokiarchaeota archaeon]